MPVLMPTHFITADYRLLPGAPQDPFHDIGGCAHLGWHDVGIGTQGEGDLSVPKNVGDVSHIQPFGP
jgi:hypothetical protein